MKSTKKTASRKTPKKAVSKSTERPPNIETELVEAYMQLQHEKGVASVVLQDMAQRVGVAFGTVRYHFNQAGRDISQEALAYLLKKAYIFVDERLFQLRQKEDFNPIHAYIRAMFDWISESAPESSFLIYYYYLSSTKVPVSISYSDFLERNRLRIEALLHEAVGRKIYSLPNDPYRASLQIHMILVGTCMAAGAIREKKTYERHCEICIEITDKILRS